jgi:hypothetical protein
MTTLTIWLVTSFVSSCAAGRLFGFGMGHQVEELQL